MADKIFNVLGALVVVAGITTVVVNANGSAQVFSSFGNAFKGMLMAAQGRG